MDFPPEIIQRFRVVAIERLERAEEAWAEVRARLDDDAATQIHREIHTLKGESHVVGYAEVNLVCHKLEDLLEVARARGYAIDDDIDLAVNLSLRFMILLIKRKQPGQPLAGIDLPGFVGQIDTLLRRHLPPPRSRPASVPPRLRPGGTTRVSPALRARLAPVAFEAFLEYAVAKGIRRDRLRGAWHAMRDLIGIQRAVIGGAQLETARAIVPQLAQTLGKQARVQFDVTPAEVTTEILQAIDVAALHLVRNAIDHGLESPDVRARAGKPPIGTITIASGLRGDTYELVVADDGAGIDEARVVARAIERGLVPAGATVSADKIVELVCHPGFSTRLEANDVSGRGVGLDAVRGGVVDIGGAVTARSVPGEGTSWRVAIPVPSLVANGHVIRSPGLRFPVVIDPAWRVLERAPELPIIVDLGQSLGFVASTSIATRVFWMTNGALAVGFVCGGRPTPIEAHRLVATQADTLGEVITVAGVEGLLVRPERIPGVQASDRR